MSIYAHVLSYLGVFLLFLLVLYPNTVELNIQNAIFSFIVLYDLFLIIIFFFLNRHHVLFDLVDGLICCFLLYLFVEYKVHDTSIARSKFEHIFLLFSAYWGLRIIVFNVNMRSFVVFLLFLVGVIEGGVGILQLLGLLQSNHAIFSITGTFFNPGPYGGYISVIGVLAGCFVLNDYCKCKDTNKLFRVINQRDILYKMTYFLAVLMLILVAIMLPFTLSRTAFISLLLPFVFYSVRKKRRWFYNFSIFKIILLLILLFVVIILMVFLYKLKLPSANGRFYIWMVSWDLIKTNFLWGHGISSFSSLFAQAQENFLYASENKLDLLNYADNIDYAFNEYIHMASEVGFIGLIFFLLIIGITLRVYLKNNSIYGYGMMALLCFAFASYPLHLLPFQILLILFLVLRKPEQKFLISRKLFLLVFMVIFLCSMYIFSNYWSRIRATEQWLISKQKVDIAGIEYRKYEELEKYNLWINDNPRFLWDYGIFLLNANKNDESVKILLQGAKLSGDPEFYTYIGVNFENLGVYEKAEKYYIKAFDLLPNRIYPLYRLCLLYYKIQDKDNFIKFANKLIVFTPKISSETTRYFKDDIIELLKLENVR